MLGKIRKRKRIDIFEYQALNTIDKEGGDDLIEKFEKKFKEIKFKGNRYNVADPDPDPDTYETKYTESN